MTRFVTQGRDSWAVDQSRNAQRTGKTTLCEASRRNHPGAMPRLSVRGVLEALAFAGVGHAIMYFVFGAF